jgi:DNA polymerase
MAIDQLKARRLEQMGLGPVWVLRMPVERPVGETRAEAAASPEHAPALWMAEHPGSHADDAIPAMDWDTLESTIRSCTSCGLCKDRGHAVPGIGDRQARWLFIGEGPGRQEDLQGEPFVGPAGKLLDNMMRALGLARGKHTYIANIVKCRPVGDDGRDRPPSADESAACMPYLERQIALIKPDVIIALGKTAAASLLGVGEDTALSVLRGKPHSYAGIPLVVTYHPAYLLRKPADKAKSWQDLCLAQRLYDER